MKTVKLIAILVLTTNAFAQSNDSYYFKYDINYNTEYPVIREGTLIIKSNLQESIFIVKSKESFEKEEKEKTENKITIEYSQNSSLYNYFNYSKNQLLTKDKILSDVYLIDEQIPKMNWDLLDEEKVINNNKVYKATTIFRGRKFIAWFSLDYPIKFGPWKFNGLPGLIFEIYDETKRYHWQLKSINPFTSSDDMKLFDINNNDFKVISINEYVDLRYNQDLGARISSKLPRDIKVLSVKTTRPNRNGIEITFEWEEN